MNRSVHLHHRARHARVSAEARLGIFLILVLLLLMYIPGLIEMSTRPLREVRLQPFAPAFQPPLMQRTAPTASTTPAARPFPAKVVSDAEIWHGDRTKKQVIFTFDAGDSAMSADGILAALAKHHVKGTFFMTGKFVDANPELVRKIVAADHEIFDHTYDHPYLTATTSAGVVGELDRMAASLERVAGISPKPYFRPPYGDRDAAVLKAAAGAGYEDVYWTVDARDWMEPNGETADQVRERILSTLAPGSIYLMHVGDSITGSILDDIFTTIESRGYRIASLTQGL